MIDGFLFVLVLLSALGCGLNAGVLFAFSSFVMPALKRLTPAQGIAAMQSINILAVTPPFMTAFFGTAVACLGLVVWAVLSLGEGYAELVLAGAALYLVGVIGVTAARNVPLNNGLAALHPQSAEATDRWNEYVRRWTAWNHLRVIAGLAAATMLTIALRV